MHKTVPAAPWRGSPSQGKALSSSQAAPGRPLHATDLGVHGPSRFSGKSQSSSGSASGVTAKLNSAVGMAVEELDRDEPLFDGQVPVTIQSSEREERVVPLTIRILSGVRTLRTQRERLLHIEITDDADPFFLYTLDVSEDEFHRLKQDQSLLVEFASFPSMVTELLEACAAETQSDVSHPAASSLGSSSRGVAAQFMAILDTTAGSAAQGVDSVFQIVEANQFKHLTHIALSFRPGCDATLKSYLAARLQQFQRSVAALSADLADTRGALEQETEAAQEAQRALGQLQAQSENDVHNMKMEHQAAGARSAAAFDQKIAELQQQHNREMRELQESFEKGTKELRSRNEQLSTERADLAERVARVDVLYAQLQRTHEGSAGEIRGLQDELEGLRAENRRLDASNFELEKSSSQAGAQMEAHAQELRDKTELLQQMTLRLEDAAEQRSQLEDTLALLKDSQDRLQGKFQDSVAEINKGNRIIKRLQADYKQLRSKMKIKSKVLRRQEDLVNEKDRVIDETHRQNMGLEADLSKANDRIERLEHELERAKSSIEEQNSNLESNAQVIKWLNQEINQMQITGRRGVLPGASTTHEGRSTAFSFEPRVPVSGAGEVGVPPLNAYGTSRTGTLHGVSAPPPAAVVHASP